MNKKIMYKNLLKMFFLLVIILILILIGSGYIIAKINKNEEISNRDRFKAEMKNYSTQVERQIAADFQTIKTLAGFITEEDVKEYDYFKEGLEKSKISNRFIRMGFLNSENHIIMANIYENKYSEYDIDDLNKSFRDMIDKSLNGEDAISDVYYDSYLNQNVVAISTPVYVNNEIIGVITATNSIDEFKSIINQSLNSTLGIIDIIDENGNFLIASDKFSKEKENNNIFNSKILSINEKEKIKEFLSIGEGYSKFEYNNKNYSYYIIKLKYSNWYLFCTDLRNTEEFIYSFNNIIIAIFILFFVLILSFSSLAYKVIKKNNIQLIKLAYFDEITQSYNLSRFKVEILELLKKDRNYVLIVLNIKNFHFINEAFGKEKSDELLLHISKVLLNNINKKECYCHEFADRFFILLNKEKESLVIKRIEKIIEEINKFSLQEAQHYNMKINAGILECDKIDSNKELDEKVIESMISYCTFALKEGKKCGKDFMYYKDSLHEQGAKVSYIEANMKKALVNEEFKLFLQPKIDLKDNTISGAEALVRWIEDSGNMIYPNDFIPLFEKNGFCIDLDLYMIEKVCQRLRSWIDEGVKIIPISINQSKKLFYMDNYVDMLSEIVDKYKISSEYIVLEMLEGLAVEDPEKLNKTIKKLHEKGFKVSMDDFGNGYSSLNSLSLLDIDELKLDCMFLLKLEEKNKEKQIKIIKNIIHIAKDMKIKTVAEGVETKENECLLKDMDCDYSQGYLYSKPISVDEFEEKYIIKYKI